MNLKSEESNILEGIKAIIFDLDGLLLDSESSWWKANEALLGKRGQEYTKELSRKVIGAGHKETMQMYKNMFGFEDDIDSLASERKKYMYEHLMKDMTFLDGGVELINELYSRGYPLAIATGGHSVEKVNQLLKGINLKDKFALIVSSEDLNRGKPHPDIYLHTASKLKIEPKLCLVFEDAVQGVMAGVAAGMRVIGVNKNEESRSGLRNAGAFLVEENLKDVLSKL